MTTAVLIVIALSVLSFASGLVGGRRILASIGTPVVLALLSILDSHSDLVAVPQGTAIASTFAWLLGFLIYIIGMDQRSRRLEAAKERNSQRTSVGSGSPTHP